MEATALPSLCSVGRCCACCADCSCVLLTNSTAIAKRCEMRPFARRVSSLHGCAQAHFGRRFLPRDGSGIFTLTEALSRTPSWPRSPWAARKRGVAPLWECRRTSTAPAEAPTTCSTPVAGEPACPHAHAYDTQVCNVACSDVGGRWPAAIVPRHRRPA